MRRSARGHGDERAQRGSERHGRAKVIILRARVLRWQSEHEPNGRPSRGQCHPGLVSDGVVSLVPTQMRPAKSNWKSKAPEVMIGRKALAPTRLSCC